MSWPANLTDTPETSLAEFFADVVVDSSLLAGTLVDVHGGIGRRYRERLTELVVKVDGAISLSDDGNEGRRFAALIGGRYMGADRAEEYGERNGVPGELLVRLHPTKITAGFDIAD